MIKRFIVYWRPKGWAFLKCWQHKKDPETTPQPCHAAIRAFPRVLTQLCLGRPGTTKRAQPSLCRLPHTAAHMSCVANSRGCPELLRPALPPARDFSDHPALETPFNYLLQMSGPSEQGGAVPRRSCPCWPLQQDRYLCRVTAAVVLAMGQGESTEGCCSSLPTLSWSNPALF